MTVFNSYFDITRGQLISLLFTGWLMEIANITWQYYAVSPLNMVYVYMFHTNVIQLLLLLISGRFQNQENLPNEYIIANLRYPAKK
jgi:hypothetical protein